MRFDSGENNVRARVGGERGADFVGRQTTERRFVENRRVFHRVGDFREGFAEPFRILTRRNERNVEDVKTVEEETSSSKKALRFGNRRNDFFLQVDNKRGRVFRSRFHFSLTFERREID